MTNTRRLLCGLTAATMLIAGCGGSDGASDKDYTAARTALSDAMAKASGGAGVDFTNDEIDCMASARDESVADLAAEVSDSETETFSDDETGELLSCMSSDTFRSMVEVSLGDNATIEAAGIDRDCVLDLMASKFDEWKEAGASVDDTDTFQGPEVQAAAAKCVDPGTGSDG